MMKCQIGIKEEKSRHSHVTKLEADTLYIYVFDNMDDWMTMHKSADMNHEVTKEAVLFVEVNL